MLFNSGSITNKDEVYIKYHEWCCYECRKSYENNTQNFYYPKCNYNLYFDCFKKDKI